ncbi:uncharacterized protein MAM_05203 [Metarhizium album ARSEF 1941]|uniref:Myb-like domain-containing protein n=1 Tax=Metarhizium album (strain ARSEF 1941) TaxID=1081103 RepID=A0A0B2WTW4_METAS|nr:uncharacterized protein MAM_05203 [Metarhizium album ARSEF 1941]KHN97094.1 hypothetical protein MAM_05203 [Metarhizium album ARSEF 1941]
MDFSQFTPNQIFEGEVYSTTQGEVHYTDTLQNEVGIDTTDTRRFQSSPVPTTYSQSLCGQTLLGPAVFSSFSQACGMLEAPGLLPLDRASLSLVHGAIYHPHQNPLWPPAAAASFADGGAWGLLPPQSVPFPFQPCADALHDTALHPHPFHPLVTVGPAFSAETPLSPVSGAPSPSGAVITPPLPANLAGQPCRTGSASSPAAQPAGIPGRSPRRGPGGAAANLAAPTAAQRAAEDRQLVALRAKGVSYADIKRVLKSDKAESTLRGRHRQLTLHPRDRERKPSWSEKDIALLVEAVPRFRRPKKVLWDHVARYIVEHGGSHKFSGLTCHKKYREQTGRDH